MLFHWIYDLVVWLPILVSNSGFDTEVAFISFSSIIIPFASAAEMNTKKDKATKTNQENAPNNERKTLSCSKDVSKTNSFFTIW